MKRSHAFSTLITQGLLGRLQKLLHVTARANHSLLLSVSPNATVDTDEKLAHNEGKRSLSRLVALIETFQT